MSEVKIESPFQPSVKPNKSQKALKEIKLPRSTRIILFIIIVSVEYAINVSSGVLSSASKEIKKKFNMNDQQFGMFSTVNGIGRTFGCILFTIIVNTLSRKWVFVTFLFLKSLLLISFMFVQNGYLLIVIRGFIGFVHMPPSNYVPVWIDQYGIKNYKTIFMTIFLVLIPMGKVSGYGVHLLVGEDNWPKGFAIEGLYLLFVSIFCALTSENYFSSVLFEKKEDNIGIELNEINDTQKDNKKVTRDTIFEEIDVSKEETKTPFFNDFCKLIHNPLYVITLLYRSLLMGVLSTIHYWIGDYMRNGLEISDYNSVFFAYSVMATGGPLIGVGLSAIVRLIVPSYEDKSAGAAMILLHFITMIIGLLIPCVKNLYVFSIIVTSYFVFSSITLPFVHGALATSVLRRLKGSAFGFGNFLTMTFTSGPFPWIYGVINDNFGYINKSIALFVTMIINVGGFCFMLIYLILKNRKEKNEKEDEESLINSIEESSDIEKQKKGK